jgi:hypothetical protein
MGFSTLHNLPMIGSVHRAEEVYESIKPIKGSAVRPLGNRKAKHYSIEKCLLGGYLCKLYGHPVLWYEMAEDKKGTILHISLCTYDTQTTRRFIQRITPFQCYAYNGKTYIEVGRRTKEEDGKYKVTNAYRLPAEHSYPIRIYIPHGNYPASRVLNPAPVTKKVFDRKITKELRDKYKESMADAEAMLRLGMAQGRETFARYSYFNQQFLDDLTREEVSEFLWLVGTDNMTKKWQSQKLQYNMQTQKYEMPEIPKPTFRSYIVDALYYVAQQDAIDIYEEVELPAGQRA